MDIRMPILDGIEATTRLVEGGTSSRVVILTTFGLDEYVLGALRAGASGFVLKEAPPEEILEAIHIVARGDALIAPAVTRTVIEELGRRPVRAELAAKLDELTPRERDVLDLVAEGMSNAEIAAALVVGEGTVRRHVAHSSRSSGCATEFRRLSSPTRAEPFTTGATATRVEHRRRTRLVARRRSTSYQVTLDRRGIRLRTPRLRFRGVSVLFGYALRNRCQGATTTRTRPSCRDRRSARARRPCGRSRPRRRCSSRCRAACRSARRCCGAGRSPGRRRS